jgi:hypothetical protein
MKAIAVTPGKPGSVFDKLTHPNGAIKVFYEVAEL